VYRLRAMHDQAEELHVLGTIRLASGPSRFVAGDVPHALLPLELPANAAWFLQLGRKLLTARRSRG